LKRIAAAAGVLLLVLVAGIIAAGCLRYGSVEGLSRRVRSEVAARQPHPVLAPTPLPVSTPSGPAAAAAPALSPASPGEGTVATARPPSTATPVPARTPLPPPATAAPSTAVTITAQAPTETPRSTPSPTPLPPQVRISGLTHMWQTWNNCGPATLAMNLSYFGLETSQADCAAVIRPNKEDKNVSPEELAVFARTQGLAALVRVNGNAGRLRALLAAGIPVLVETWHEPKPNDGMGHYRLLTGYDDTEQAWIAYDSYDAAGIDPKKSYAGIRIPYEQLDPLWKVFNRPYVVIAPEARSAEVKAIVGQDSDDQAMWARALGDAQAAVQADPRDPFAWFNLGSDLTALGRYEDAAQAYDKARQIGLPWRMFWYQYGAFQAYYEARRYDEVVALANATLRTAKYVEELYYWRGLAQLAQGKPAEARISFQQALEMNRNFTPAAEALAGLSTP
jgi:tetratricopeptide (TPR) repeat protein